MEPALKQLKADAEKAVRDGYNIIILSDRKASAERVPMPSLLACAAVHHHLIREGLRTSVGLVVESGEPREVHHFACLAGYGAEAINPYLAFETLVAMKDRAAAEARREGNRQALHQVGRQGPAQGDVQDGHLDLSVLLRRADFRRGRPEGGIRRDLFHRHRHPHRRRRPAGDRGRSRAPASRRLRRRRRSTRTRSMSAANISSACAARIMPGTRRRSPPCSTRCAAIPMSNTANSRRC